MELDGVSASLGSCPGVRGAKAVLIHQQLFAFLTPRDCDVTRVSENMQVLQPYYARPEKFITLDSLPTTTNGKIDKNALKELTLEDNLSLGNNKGSAEDTVSSSDALSTATLKNDSSSSIETVVHDVQVVDPEKVKMENLNTTSDLPEKSEFLRSFRYRVFIVYRRLFSVIWLPNIIALVILVVFPHTRRKLFGRLPAINLTVAVLDRQDFVINTLYTVSCSVPRSWPLGIRKHCAKIYHLGGVHSGAASAAIFWFISALVYKIKTKLADDLPGPSVLSNATLVVCCLVVLLLLIVAGFAWPPFRKAHHDIFERVHRFVGWSALALLWAQTILSINDERDLSHSFGIACVREANFWLILVATLSITSSWFTLKKVNVESEVLSNHAIRLHFDYVVPVNGSFTRLSERPLLEWHSFATIPSPEFVQGRPKGYSLVVSNAGDWTKRQISRAPSKIWIRGVPSKPAPKVLTLQVWKLIMIPQNSLRCNAHRHTLQSISPGRDGLRRRSPPRFHSKPHVPVSPLLVHQRIPKQRSVPTFAS